ncbi:MAG: hypothetical protein US42_C0002G0056 [Candidatus Magasanikbacteria bacterium GW2011_GWC2_37_14]|uniref:Rod shape-determining protein MreD n=1 Tax=Candidatus Magasanikbacteria bacterium GW2011_GWC2_37_14 TaxID=1619046 RepID=A0A0G0JJ72_9BACT|nr:MAG: hypothetical protein US42_C0002G0056 [Candidatus Magasanikbacteria bacterium GW2011_GWC2_37_14]
MPSWLRFIFIILFIVFITSLHVGAVYLLPYPLSKMNVLFSFFIIMLLWQNSGKIVWMVFFSHFLIELFTVSPFGIILFSSVIAFLISYWLYQNVFTNRSWYAALVLSVFTLSIYRILYITLLFLGQLLGWQNNTPLRLVLVTSFWELLTTTGFLIIIYFIFSRFSKKLSSAVVIESSIYGR